MAAFKDEENFSIEFALRTFINCYRIYELNKESFEEHEINELEKTFENVCRKIEVNDYLDLSSCFGTQLMNSILGLLIFPEQQFYNTITKSNNPNVWHNLFPTLSNYIFANDFEVFEFKCYTWSKQEKCAKKEEINIRAVLKHMRNSVSHKKISLIPKGIIATRQVKNIVFTDDSKIGDKYSRFMLKISKNDLLPILLEIFNYFINIEEYKEKIKDWK